MEVQRRYQHFLLLQRWVGEPTSSMMRLCRLEPQLGSQNLATVASSPCPIPTPTLSSCSWLFSLTGPKGCSDGIEEASGHTTALVYFSYSKMSRFLVNSSLIFVSITIFGNSATAITEQISVSVLESQLSDFLPVVF